MKIDAAALQLLILATPGLIWALFESSLRNQAKVQQFLFTVKVLVYGLISFALLGVIYSKFGWQFDVLNFSNGATFASRLDEILWSVPVAIVLAMISVANQTHGWSTSFLRSVGITDFSGTDDIWEFSLSIHGRQGEYVYVRDFEHDLAYFGYVLAYSDGTEKREILLEDVEVYDLDGALLYKLERIYLSLSCEGARIEFPGDLTEQTDVKRQQKTKPISTNASQG